MKKIYILEDNDHIRELLEFVLRDQGYTVTSFPNAKSFTSQIELEHPDVILMDVMLPDGNGIEICSDLYNSDETNHIPVILMSAHVEDFKAPCAKDFLPKPFDIDNLLYRISRQLYP